MRMHRTIILWPYHSRIEYAVWNNVHAHCNSLSTVGFTEVLISYSEVGDVLQKNECTIGRWVDDFVLLGYFCLI